MGNIFNDDFIDFLRALNNQNVQYMLVGGYSVILHGYSRTTGDMDILVAKTDDNYQKLSMAFSEFGMPVFDMTKEKFLNNSAVDVFTFGRQPSAIDILTDIKGASFDELYEHVIKVDVDGLSVNTVHLNQLIQLKQASGRYKDLDDIEKLTSN